MEHPERPLPLYLGHFSEEPDCAVKIEKEEFFQETFEVISFPYIPESGPAKDEYLNSPLNFSENCTERHEEPDCAGEIKKEEFFQDTFKVISFPFIPESDPAKNEYLNSPLNFSENCTERREEEPDHTITIEKEEFVQESYGETLGPNIYEYGSAKDVCMIDPFYLPNNAMEHQEENSGMNLDCSRPKLKIQKNVSTTVLKNRKMATMLLNDSQTNTVQRPFMCNICSARFADKGQLNKHIRTHSGEKPFACSSCSARFGKKGTLVNHIRTHTGEKPFECNSCSARFAHKSNLVSHIRTHTWEKPYKCDSCSAKFSEKGTLVAHIRTHTGEKPYKCNSCSARFAVKCSLDSHIRTHSGEKPFECSSCSARFARKSYLVKHNRTHTGEKPYTCSYCLATFADRGNLVKHIRTHTGEKPFECNSCPAKFSKKCTLVSHIQTHSVL